VSVDRKKLTLLVLVVWAVAAVAAAQTSADPDPVQPPAGSAPVLRTIQIRFPKQRDVSAIEPQTYLYYIKTQPSRPSTGKWVMWSDELRQSLLEDYRRLWATSFLDDLTLSVEDRPYPNGVIGKHVIFDMEERPRVKIVDYVGSKEVESAKIDEKLREENITVRLDSFLDESVIRRVKAVVRGMLAEKGYHESTITHEVQPVSESSPKVVHLTFHIEQGPKYKIRNIDFIGNKAVSDRKLRKRMKETKALWWPVSMITGRGTYKETKYEEDAEKVQGYYRDQGFITTQIGNPEVKTLETSEDGQTRYIELRIPVMEGPRYKVGTFDFTENKVVKSAALKPLFKLKEGDYYNEQALRKGLEKARELYGSGGYWEFTGYPAFKRHDEADPNATAEERAAAAAQPAVVDVTMHLQEGEQFFVNRITFVGNTTTRDRVIRRELPIVENGIFNSESLKYGVKRLNQLGYFKQLEPNKGDAIKVEKTKDEKNKVDVTLHFEEQNRNQLQFGAGYSQLDGTFINGSFSTSNFLGLGETFSLGAQTGARSNNYQFGITEPYMFDRPVSAGVVLFTRKYDYLMSTGKVGYSEVRTGASVTGGYPVGRFTRLFGNYAYEVIDTAISKDLQTGAGDPLFNSYLDNGRNIESRTSPSLVYNTVDNPFTPRDGMRFTGTYEVAGGLLGGTVNYIRPDAELIIYRPMPWSRRMAIGVRGEAGYIKAYSDTKELPYYRKFFLGGENQIRGYNIRTVGPLNASNQALGGDKFLLFNAEYYIDIAGPVRFLLFHDAGQAWAEHQRYNLRDLRTSSGVELRVVMPVMNVPFRLIYAWNVYRDTFQPARTFKFAVGTTF
jgi:outer membrane protein insertion porin family